MNGYLWLFVSVVGVEPTNNEAERAIRPAVIWRRTSFGSQSQDGSTFVSRMLTVVTTLKSQHRNVLEFITSSVKATRERQRILDFRFAILDWEEVEQGRTDQSLP